MKKNVSVTVDIPDKIYYIDYIYDYRDCQYAERCVYENKFFYDEKLANDYAKFKGLTWEQYDIEELTLGALSKEEVLKELKEKDFEAYKNYELQHLFD